MLRDGESRRVWSRQRYQVAHAVIEADPSELDRLRELMGADTGDDPPRVPPARTGEIALLRELLTEKDRTMAEKDRMIHNLIQERDEWREQCKKHLMLLPPGPPPKKRWWRFGKGA